MWTFAIPIRDKLRNSQSIAWVGFGWRKWRPTYARTYIKINNFYVGTLYLPWKKISIISIAICFFLASLAGFSGQILGGALFAFWNIVVQLEPLKTEEISSYSNLFVAVASGLLGLIGVIYGLYVFFHQRLIEQTPESLRDTFALAVPFHRTVAYLGLLSALNFLMAISVTMANLPWCLAITALQIPIIWWAVRRSIQNLTKYLSPYWQIDHLCKSYQRDVIGFEKRLKLYNWAVEDRLSDADRKDLHIVEGVHRQQVGRREKVWSLAGPLTKQVLNYSNMYVNKGDIQTAETVINGIPVILYSHFQLQRGTMSNAPWPFDNLRTNNDRTLQDLLEDFRGLLTLYFQQRNEGAYMLLQKGLFLIANTCLTIEYVGSRENKHCPDALLVLGYLENTTGAAAAAGMPDITMDGLRRLSSFGYRLIAMGAPADNLTGISKMAMKFLVGARLNPSQGQVVEQTWVDFFYTIIPQSLVSKKVDYRYFYEDLIATGIFHLIEQAVKSNTPSILTIGLQQLLDSIRLNGLVEKLVNIQKTASTELTKDNPWLYYNLLKFLDREDKGWFHFISTTITKLPNFSGMEYQAIHSHIRSICGILSQKLPAEAPDHLRQDMNEAWEDWFYLYYHLFTLRADTGSHALCEDDWLDIASWFDNVPELWVSFFTLGQKILSTLIEKATKSIHAPGHPNWPDIHLLNDITTTFILALLDNEKDGMKYAQAVLSNPKWKAFATVLPKEAASLRKELTEMGEGWRTNLGRGQQQWWRDLPEARRKVYRANIESWTSGWFTESSPPAAPEFTSDEVAEFEAVMPRLKSRRRR